MTQRFTAVDHIQSLADYYCAHFRIKQLLNDFNWTLTENDYAV